MIVLDKVYLRIKVLHGCCKPVYITLRLYTNLTLPVTEFPFHKKLSSENMLEKRPPTMTLTSICVIINKHMNSDVICQVRGAKSLILVSSYIVVLMIQPQLAI